MGRTLPYRITGRLAVVIVALAAASSMNAGQENDQLLPQARHVSGTVVDDSGNPIAGASIDHSYYRERLYEHYQSAADGRFSLETRAPSLVVRKPGFRSAFILTGSSESMTVTLHSIGAAHIPVCKDKANTIGIDDGWGARLRFTPVDSMKTRAQGHDVDYGYRAYRLKKGGRKYPVIMHGAGPMWGPGEPFDRDVWTSVTYEETVYGVGREQIVDAHGEDANHHHWRSIGLSWGETVTYSDADDATAREFDRFLDGVCVLPKLTQSR